MITGGFNSFGGSSIASKSIDDIIKASMPHDQDPTGDDYLDSFPKDIHKGGTDSGVSDERGIKVNHSISDSIHRTITDTIV